VGGADFGEAGRNVGRGVVKGGAGVADRDEHEVHPALVSASGAEEGVVLLGLLCTLVVEAVVQKPISKRMREQSLRSKESGSGVGSAGTPRA
jgi:hypothetical protein